MFDHVDLRASDFPASARAYRSLLAVLGAATIAEEGGLDWGDFGLFPAEAGHPGTSGVHIGLVAPSRDVVDAFWQAGLDVGLADDGAPGPRTEYAPEYYGGFLRDPDGNSIEACVHPNSSPPGWVDHVWLRVADVAAARDFYAALEPFTGFALVVDEPDLARFRGPSASFTVVAGTPVSRHLHLAFPADDDARVDAFHAAALDAGYRDNGAPGERPHYHPGYYGAFVLDPDGHNVEVVNHNR